jgi:hypothetical protein
VSDGLRCPDIAGALELSANSDSKLVLLVGTDPRVLRVAGEQAADELRWPMLKLNVELGQRLAAFMPAERGDVAWDLLLDVIGEHQDGVVLIGTDLLWEPSLGYDPYRTLRRLGRRGPLIATWFGRVDGPDIIRAEPGHPEYTRDRLDVPYVLVD